MTTLQIHLTMAALGVAVCLAFAGLVSYRHYPAFKRTLLGIITGGLVALSPFMVSLGGYVSEGLMPKSLLLSFAAVLGGILIYTLSRWPLKEHATAGKSTYDPSRAPVVLTADNTDDINAVEELIESSNKDIENDEAAHLLPDTTVEDFPTLALDKEPENGPIYDVSDDDIFEVPEPEKTPSEKGNSVEDIFDIDEPFRDNLGAKASDVATFDDNTQADDVEIDNSTIFELTGQHDIPGDSRVPVAESAPAESIPSNDKTIAGSGTNEIQTEIAFNTDDLTDKLDLTEELADDAAVVDDAPARAAMARSVELDSVLQGKLDELDATLSTLSAASMETSDESSNEATDADSLISAVDAESFDAAESDVQTATESLMALQRKVLEQNEQQRQLISDLQARSSEQHKQHQAENSRIRGLIKNTSRLTREMVDQQQTLRDAVEQEKAARLKSEASAKKALEIAQTAISRLSKAKAASRVNAIKFKPD